MKRVLLGVLVWLLATSLAMAAVSIGETTGGILQTAGIGTTFSFNFQNSGTPAADRITAVTIQNYDNGASSEFITNVTIDGNTATCVGNINDGAGEFEQETCWILNPTGTSTSIVVTVATGADLHQVLIDIFSVTGANTSTPIFSSPTGTDSTVPSSSVTIPTSGALLASSSTLPTVTPQTPAWTNATSSQHNSCPFGACYGTALSTTSGAPTVSANWTQVSFTNALISLVSFQPPGSGASAITRRSLTGVGN